MSEFTDIMVDLETTGTDPQCNNIIQLAAVKFNLMTGEVSGDTFDKGLTFAPRRFWDEGTREFWGRMPEIYNSIIERAELPERVLDDFNSWVGADAYRFWAKPVTFDWTFLDSYYKQYGKRLPFHYRTARDMNSYIAGLIGNPEHPNTEHDIPFEGKEHHALWDCFHQIKILMHTQKKYA